MHIKINYVGPRGKKKKQVSCIRHPIFGQVSLFQEFVSWPADVLASEPLTLIQLSTKEEKDF